MASKLGKPQRLPIRSHPALASPSPCTANQCTALVRLAYVRESATLPCRHNNCTFRWLSIPLLSYKSFRSSIEVSQLPPPGTAELGSSARPPSGSDGAGQLQAACGRRYHDNQSIEPASPPPPPAPRRHHQRHQQRHRQLSAPLCGLSTAHDVSLASYPGRGSVGLHRRMNGGLLSPHRSRRLQVTSE